MENEIIGKRSLILILVITSAAIFVGLVWLIATYLPRSRSVFGPNMETSTPHESQNCTYPISYWLEHTELYPPQIVIGSRKYQSNDIREALSGSDQNLATQLQAQLLGAFLNVSAGADQELIEGTIFNAYRWVVQHSVDDQVSTGDFENGMKYHSVLEAYNLGLAGVPPCEGGYTQAFTRTAPPSITPTLLLTITPSQTLTAIASETSSPTSQVVTPIYTIAPTHTSNPTTEAPNQLPSNTPIQPTEQPLSTPTEKPPPPDTPTNTLQPPDTPTNTLEATATITPPVEPTATITPPLP
jgi:hypothetical protein